MERSSVGPPPTVDEQALRELTFEQLAQLVNERSPDGFYRGAMAFDSAAARFQQLHDDLRRESKALFESVRGELRNGFEDVTHRQLAWLDSVHEAMAYPGYAKGLRQAGDALATAQQRFQDLVRQKGEQDAAAPPAGAQPEQLAQEKQQQGEQRTEQARRIVLDLGTAYREVGMTFSSLPTVPGAARMTDVGNGVPNATGGGAAPAGFVAGRFAPGGAGTMAATTGAVTGDGATVTPAAGVPQGESAAVGEAGGLLAGGGAVLGRPAAAVGGAGGPGGPAVLAARPPAMAARTAAVPSVPSAAATTSRAVPAPAAGAVSAEPTPQDADPYGVFASGVLGRTAVASGTGRDVPSGSGDAVPQHRSEQESPERPAEEPLGPDGTDRPVTVSSEADGAADRTADAQQTAAEHGRAELPRTAIEAGATATAGGVATSGGSGEAPSLAGAEPVDPGELGMTEVGGNASTGGAALQELGNVGATQPGAVPMGAAATGPATASGTTGGMAGAPHGMGMAPMMMGGMRGGGGQRDNDRYAELPVKADPEQWDPPRPHDAVLGRPRTEPVEPAGQASPATVDELREQALEILGKSGERRK